MAADLRPNALAVRTTLVSPEVDAKVLAFVKALAPVHLVIRHNPDDKDANPHWHHLLYTTKSAQVFRVELTKAIPEIKRKYSVEQVKPTLEDHEAMERYMCHADVEGGQVHIVSAQAAVYHPAGAYTQAWAQEQNKRYYQVQRAFVKKKKEQKGTVTDKIVRLCQERGVRAVTQVAQVMVEVYKEERRDMNTYAMKGKLRTILCILNGESAIRDVVAEITQGLVEEPSNFLHKSTTVSCGLDDLGDF